MMYLVRHGETEWNAAGRYQGARDSALTAKGRSQATAIGRLLDGITGPGLLRASVSPLGRTRQTAALIAAEIPLDITFDDRLAEVSTGAWDGLTPYEIEMEFPGALAGSTAFDWYFRAPDGEPLEAVIGRVTSWLEDQNGPVVAVSHGLVGRILRGVFLGLKTDEMLTLPCPQEGLFELFGGQATYHATGTERFS